MASTSFQNIEHVTAEGEEEINLDMQIANNNQREETRKSRKRKRDPSKWKKNVRKDKRNRGEAYISSRNKPVPAKMVKNLKDCTRCKKRCSDNVSDEVRSSLFHNYYELTAEQKRLFVLSNTVKVQPKRRRDKKTPENSKKQNSYLFYFQVNGKKIQVCKTFFLGTLCISQKTVYNVHQSSNAVGNTPTMVRHGKHTKHKIPEDVVQSVRDHIASFPKIDSHYCRADTSRSYLDSSLSVAKLYDLYKKAMEEQDQTPVKLSYYREIFCTEFNICFQKPKKDRCDVCELIRLHDNDQREIDNASREEYEKHIREKKACRNRRQSDRELKEKVVLSFDLQNVLTCPKAEVSKFFYKSKLSVYNLTAHLSLNNQVYCAIWSENLMGRKGTDIASAVCKLLSQVMSDHPEIQHITLWSDSCVPQNRNSIISFALSQFLWQTKNLESITIRYSTPGHSCVQEVDAVHSAIERILSKVEYYSPLSLIRILLKVNRHKPYKVIQMKLSDFKNYQYLSSQIQYEKIPFSKVTTLHFSKATPNKVFYKTSHMSDQVTECQLLKNEASMKSLLDDEARPSTSPTELPSNKIESIRFMLKWMPLVDQEFYMAAIPQLKLHSKKKKK